MDFNKDQIMDHNEKMKSIQRYSFQLYPIFSNGLHRDCPPALDLILSHFSKQKKNWRVFYC